MDLKAKMLEKYKESVKDDDVSTCLTDAVKLYMSEEVEVFSYNKTLRASQLGYQCPREVVLRNLLPLPEPRRVKGSMNMQFSMETGTFLHYYIQNFVLGPMGVLFGDWIPWEYKDDPYSEKSSIYFEFCRGFYPDNGERWFYREDRVKHKELRLTGHLDGYVCLNRLKEFLTTGKAISSASDLKQDLALLEIKSTRDDILRKIKDRGLEEVNDSYLIQAVTYQKCTGFDKTVFLYIERKYWAMHPLLFKFDSKYWDIVEREATAIWDGIENKVLPERSHTCPFASAATAKKCMYKDVCFTDGIEEIIKSEDFR